MPKVSVVVPCYNVATYIDKCLDSLINQTLKDIEIICVNDASMDDTLEHIQKYVKKDNRISLIDFKTNKGVSVARNAGLDMAKGELIGFVDSDDRIDRRMYAVLYENMMRENAQISCCGIKYVKDNIIQGYDNANLREYRIENSKEALMDFLDGKKISTSACDKLFRVELFANKRFKARVRFEDKEMIPKLIAASQRIVYTGEPLYLYEQSPDSIMRGTDISKYYDLFNIAKSNYCVYEENKLGDDPRVIENHLATCIYALSNMAEDKSLTDKRIEIVSHIRSFGKYDRISRLLQFKIRLACSNLAAFDIASRLYHVKNNGAKI